MCGPKTKSSLLYSLLQSLWGTSMLCVRLSGRKVLVFISVVIMSLSCWLRFKNPKSFQCESEARLCLNTPKYFEIVVQLIESKKIFLNIIFNLFNFFFSNNWEMKRKWHMLSFDIKRDENTRGEFTGFHLPEQPLPVAHQVLRQATQCVSLPAPTPYTNYKLRDGAVASIALTTSNEATNLNATPNCLLFHCIQRKRVTFQSDS